MVAVLSKIFKGEEIQVDKFQEICKALTLESDWEAVAGLEDSPDSVDLLHGKPPEPVRVEQESSVDIDSLYKSYVKR